MKKKHLRRIRDKFENLLYNKKIICLDVPDDYGFMDEELVETGEAYASPVFIILMKRIEKKYRNNVMYKMD